LARRKNSYQMKLDREMTPVFEKNLKFYLRLQQVLMLNWLPSAVAWKLRCRGAGNLGEEEVVSSLPPLN